MAQKILSTFILISLVCLRVWAVREPPIAEENEALIAGQFIKYTKVVGNQKLDEAVIFQAISSKPGSKYDEAIVQRDKDKIAELYRQHGYFQTKCNVEIRSIPEGVTLTFSISEGIQSRVGQIIFAGNRIADDEQLRKEVKEIKVGRKYEPQKLNDDIIRLKKNYQKLRRSAGTVYSYPTTVINSEVEYISAENQVIITINITEGVQVFIQFSVNKHIKSKHLLKGLPLLERGNLSQFTLKKSVASIEEKYKKKGYYLVKVTYETTPEPPQGVVVNFQIDEGKPTYLSEIRFEGNDSIPAKKLRKYIATKPRSFWAKIPILRRWVSKGIYDENILAIDIHALSLFYQQRGYHQVKINLKEIQIQKNRIHLLIPLNEGPQLRVKEPPEVEFLGEPKGEAVGERSEHIISKEDILANLTAREGQPYNPDTLLTDEIFLKSQYSEKGYVYAKIESIFSDGIVTFKINEGKRARLGEVKFFGNEKTKENILKREFLIKEGDWFNTTKISQTQQRLYALGLFSSAVFEIPDMISEKGTVDLLVKLKERKMNSFHFSGGYNPSEGYLGSIESFHKNLFGRSRQLGVTLSQGGKGSRYEVSFMEPWLFNTRTRSMIRLFRDNLEEQDDVLATGGGVSLARDWNLAAIALEYQYQLVDQSKLLEKLNSQDGLSTISSVELSFRRDIREPFLSPIKGWLHEINLKYAGGPLLRGDNSFFKFDSDVRYYQSVKHSVLAFALRTGYAHGLGLGKDENIISLERFRAGGSTTVRGYKERSLGPTDEFGLYRGDIEFIFNAELRFPIYELPFTQAYIPKKIGGVVFFDTGNIWNKFEDIKETWLESSIGAGLRIDTPIGPVRLDYGYPLAKELRREWWRRIYFTLGHAF